jgi:Flp pilus assembly protein TadD
MISLKRHLAAVVLLTSLTTLAFANILGNKFVYDDNYQILRNPLLRKEQPWLRLFTTDVWGFEHPEQRGASNYYRPLQMLTYRIVGLEGGLIPTYFHAVSLLFHLLATFAAYAILWQLTRSRNLALACSVLFALHPIHTEAVAWISALPELGCALFFFLSFYLFLLAEDDVAAVPGGPKKVEGSAGPRLTLLFGSYLCFLIALFWKEMAVTLPLLIAAYIVFFPRSTRSVVSPFRRAISATLPYGCVFVGYLVVRFLVLGAFYRPRQDWVFTASRYLFSVLELVGEYWFKLLVPARLSAFHVFHPVQSLADLPSLVAAVFVVLAAAAILYGIRRFPAASFAGAWVFLTLLPVLSLRSVGLNVFAERYLYIPSLGFCLLVGWIADKGLILLPESFRRWVGGVALALLAVLFFQQTVRRNADWKDNFTLYSRTVEASPDSAVMQDLVAEALRTERGDLAGAEHHYLLAITVAQESQPPQLLQVAVGNVGLAYIYNQRGQYEEALKSLDKAQVADPDYPEMRIVRGVVLTQAGRSEEAEKILREALKTYPHNENALNALGIIALEREDYGQAIDLFEQALRWLAPTDVFNSTLRNNLGVVYGKLQRYPEAVLNYQDAIAISPGDPQYHTNLGKVLVRMGRFREGRAEFERALALAPDYAPARRSLDESVEGERP